MQRITVENERAVLIEHRALSVCSHWAFARFRAMTAFGTSLQLSQVISWEAHSVDITNTEAEAQRLDNELKVTQLVTGVRGNSRLLPGEHQREKRRAQGISLTGGVERGAGSCTCSSQAPRTAFDSALNTRADRGLRGSQS